MTLYSAIDTYIHTEHICMNEWAYVFKMFVLLGAFFCIFIIFFKVLIQLYWKWFFMKLIIWKEIHSQFLWFTRKHYFLMPFSLIKIFSYCCQPDQLKLFSFVNVQLIALVPLMTLKICIVVSGDVSGDTWHRRCRLNSKKNFIRKKLQQCCLPEDPVLLLDLPRRKQTTMDLYEPKIQYYLLLMNPNF